MNRTTYKDISEYIATFPPKVQLLLEQIRQAIKEVAPDLTEAISYQMPTYKLKGKNVVHFAGYKHHIGFYPTPSGVTTYEKELAPFKTSKGAAQFPLDKQIPIELIKKIVAFRVAELSKGKQ